MSPPPSERSHLSIGEVLSLLQDEFPDVTISKIRFLESQGLLDPERTPSGYRKFYETDIERLRWILRQQKDHYLPLKVIKDRLDDLDAPPAEPAGAGNAADRARDRRAGRRADALGRPDVPGGTAPVPSPAPGPAPAERRAAPLGPTGGPTNGHPVRLAVDERQPSGEGGDTAGGERAGGRETRRDTLPGRPTRVANGTPPGSPPPGSPPPDDRGAGPPIRPAPVPAGAGGAPGGPDRAASVSLTIDELAEASGMTARDLRDLERFGLLEGQVVGDATYYDGDALVVARTAGGFLQHGIEARHLRTYKIAVDREAGLFEQLILPLLKQRNPDARRLAGRTVSELVHLGEVMRSTLLRRELRSHLDP